MKIQSIWISMVMAGSMPVFADAPVPQDFAFGFEVDIETRGALYELELPDNVYRSVVRADLGDIRVFNSSGQVVPHMLRLPSAELGQAPEPTEVAFFPIYTQGEEDSARQMLRIITGDKGTIVDSTSMAVPNHVDDRVTHYLLDISTIEYSPNRLKLAWERPKGAGFAASVEVASSNDLSRWSSLVGDVTLADLESDAALLAHDVIELPVRKARYLRITWPESLREVKLIGVLASFPAAGKPLPHRWLEVPGASNKEDPRTFEFDTGGYWPTDTARIDFSLPNVVVHAALMSRPTQEANWESRYSGVFYTLQHNGTALKSEASTFRTATDRYWRFRIADKERQLTGSPPTLELGWVPHLLTFVAQGEPPYTVAFGSATMDAAARPMATLLHSIDEVKEKGLIVPVTASTVFTLGGEIKLQPPEAPFPWRTLVLWTVLLAGVVMLAWMVRGLFRKMATQDGSR